jgi:hypothetical protein
MTIVLMTIYTFGFSVGFVQGQFDPENHSSFFGMFENLAREVQVSTFAGMSVGAYTACLVWLIRSYEKLVDGGLQGETPELQLSIDSLNFDDTEEVKSTSSDLFKNKHPRGLRFDADDDDEEGMSLIKNKDL